MRRRYSIGLAIGIDLSINIICMGIACATDKATTHKPNTAYAKGLDKYISQTSPPLERLPQINPSILAAQPVPLKPSADTLPIPQPSVNSEEINVLHMRYEAVRYLAIES